MKKLSSKPVLVVLIFWFLGAAIFLAVIATKNPTVDAAAAQRVSDSLKQAHEMAAKKWFLASRRYEDGALRLVLVNRPADGIYIGMNLVVEDVSVHWDDFAKLKEGDLVKFEVDRESGAWSLNLTVVDFLKPTKVAQQSQ